VKSSLRFQPGQDCIERIGANGAARSVLSRVEAEAGGVVFVSPSGWWYDALTGAAAEKAREYRAIHSVEYAGAGRELAGVTP
jgi:hypothetical protein